MRKYVPMIVVLVVGGTLTVAAVLGARLLDRREMELEFARFADDRIRLVRLAIGAQQDSMHAIKVFFDTAGALARDQFRTLARPLLDRSPSRQALEWVPRVPHAERLAHERAARADGFPGFRFTEQGPDRQLVTAEKRDEYFPVYYVEPYAGNESALGYDVASDPTRHEALVRARDHDGLAATARVVLVQETGEQYGTLLFLPRFAAPSPRTLEERRQTLTGFVLGVFRVDDMLDAALSYFEPVGIDVAIVDESAPPGQQLLAFRASPTRPMAEEATYEEIFGIPAAVRRSVRFDVGGRTWRIDCRPAPVLLASAATLLPWVAFGAGLLLTGLAVGYVETTTARRAATDALVESERALRQSERRFRALTENAPEAIMVLDVDAGRFADVNANAVALFKRSREELLTFGLADINPPRQPDGKSERDAAELIRRALAGEAVVFEWLHRDGEGHDVPCEIRLVRLPSDDRRLVRASLTDITARKEAEAHRMFLMRELDHRVKNNLAAVLSLTERTAALSRSVDELRESLTGRIRALARLHQALASKDWKGVTLEELVRLSLDAFMRTEPARVTTRGEDLLLPARAGSPLCMALHELTTNAAKYGALSTPHGSLGVTWSCTDDHEVHLTWRESGGPRVERPDRHGFGISLIRGLIEYELGGRVELDFPPHGLECRMRVPLDPSPDVS
jgi:PAS domain S-box-containing protein